MGFGLRIPGVRVSTRGIRVGPKFANVKVGRGGVRASVGPRIARVSVGSRGITASTGLGPVHISNRGAGIRVGGGLGGVSVSTRGVGGFVGPGPFWLGGNVKLPKVNRRATRNQQVVNASRVGRAGLSNSATVFVRSSPSISATYAGYQQGLVSAGVMRRNRFEIRSAAAQSLFWEMSTIVAFARKFQKILAPNVPVIPTSLEIQNKSRVQIQSKLTYPHWGHDGSLSSQRLSLHAKRVAKSKGTYKFWQSNRHSAVLVERELLKVAIGQDIDLLVRSQLDLTEKMRSDKRAIDLAIRSAVVKFESLDPDVVGVVMQALLSDNPTPATWIGLENQSGLVLMAFGDSDAVVWPESDDISDAGHATVSKRSVTETRAMHQAVLLRALLATAKEILCATPKLKRVRVIAVENNGLSVSLDRDVWGEITVEQGEVHALEVEQSWTGDWTRVSEEWEMADGLIDDNEENYFFTSLNEISLKLHILNEKTFERFGSKLKGHVSKKSKAMVPMGKLRDLISSDGVDWKKCLDNSDYVKDIKLLSTTDVNSVDFWIDVYDNFVV